MYINRMTRCKGASWTCFGNKEVGIKASPFWRMNENIHGEELRDIKKT